jgi:YD repeat-containing protein
MNPHGAPRTVETVLAEMRKAITEYPDSSADYAVAVGMITAFAFNYGGRTIEQNMEDIRTVCNALRRLQEERLAQRRRESS